MVTRFRSPAFAIITTLVCCFGLPADSTPNRWVPSDGVLDVAGHYTLRATRKASALTNIAIRANGVRLDLGGHTLVCDPPHPTTQTTLGIDVAGRQGTEIRNGRITNCHTGVRARNTTDLVVTRVHFDSVRYLGIDSTGSNHIFRDNQFSRVGGYHGEAYAVGINVRARGGAITDNRFDEIYRQSVVTTKVVGEGAGIIIGAKSDAVSVRGNVFTNSRIEAGAIGIWTGNGANNITVLNNTFVRLPYPVVFDRGVSGTIVQNCMTLAPLVEPSFQMAASTVRATAIFGHGGQAGANVVIGYAEPIGGAIASSGNTVLATVPTPLPSLCRPAAR